jgi:hypothetical protein
LLAKIGLFLHVPRRDDREGVGLPSLLLFLATAALSGAPSQEPHP